MVEFLQFTLSGVSFGMIYAAVALSLVLIWRGTRLLNYAQGGMAMLTTYVAIEVIYHTGSYWTGFVAALAAGIVLGVVCQLTVIRPTLNKPPLNAVIVTIGLLILLEGLAGIFFGGQYRSFPTAFSQTGLKINGTPLGVSRYDVFVAAAVLVTTLALAAAFRYTSAGLRMRAAAFNATIARLSGIRVARVLTVGWALAGLLGALASFLNAQKVPDVFVASGCECWNDPSKYPETFGWQLDYVREGKILGQYVKQHFAGKKVAYFYQNDEFGLDGVKGLDYEIPSSMVVSRQSYVPTNTNVAPQVTAMHASGAQVIVAFSIPAFTALLKLNSLKLGYNPTLVVSDVGSDPITLAGLVTAYAKQGGATVNGNQLINGIISDAYLPALSTSDSWYVLFKKVHDQYEPKAPLDGNFFYGMSVAYTFVQAMLKAGKNPTRADLVTAIQGGMPQGPAVAPYSYSSSDHAGITGAYMGVIKNGVLAQQGPVLVTDTSASGAITTYSGTEQQAPATGIPSP